MRPGGADFGKLVAELVGSPSRVNRVGKGSVIAVEEMRVLIRLLDQLSEISREALFKHEGLMCLRRRVADGRYFFIANRGDKAVDGWVPVGTRAKSVAIMDPMTGRIGVTESTQIAANQTEVRLNLPPGASVILRTFDTKKLTGPAFPELPTAHSTTSTLAGNWQVKFLSGGPNLPATFATERLASWTESGDTNAASFANLFLDKCRAAKTPMR